MLNSNLCLKEFGLSRRGYCLEPIALRNEDFQSRIIELIIEWCGSSQQIHQESAKIFRPLIQYTIPRMLLKGSEGVGEALEQATQMDLPAASDDLPGMTWLTLDSVPWLLDNGTK